MKSIKLGEQSIVEFSNCNVKGLSIEAILQAAVVNVNLATQTPNSLVLAWDNISLKITLVQNGRKVQIFSGQILALLRALNFKNAYHQFTSPVDGTIALKTLTAFGAAAYHVVEIPMIVPFGRVLNLQGADKLTVEYNFPFNACGTAINASTSYFSLDTIEGVGIQTEIPVFEVIAVQASERNIKPVLGDNVEKITFINYENDIRDETLGNQILDRVIITAKDFNSKHTYYDHLRARVESWPVDTNPLRYQSFVLYDGKKELDSCLLEIDFINTNVNASQNYVVVQRHVTDANIMQRAVTATTAKNANAHAKVMSGHLRK